MNQVQLRLKHHKGKPIANTTHKKPQVNYLSGNIQRIETSRGCRWNCPFCYEPREKTFFPIPMLVSNYVQILDMNFLDQPDIERRIIELGKIQVNGKVIYYECVCGFDYRLLTQEIAKLLKTNRFVKPRLAWDWGYEEQRKIQKVLKYLIKAGYRNKEIMIFMIINWKIPYEECLKKLDLLKVWNIKVCDCCFDGGYKYAIPLYWTSQQIKDFRAKCRKHNQLINFGIDPEI